MIKSSEQAGKGQEGGEGGAFLFLSVTRINISIGKRIPKAEAKTCKYSEVSRSLRAFMQVCLRKKATNLDRFRFQINVHCDICHFLRAVCP